MKLHFFIASLLMLTSCQDKPAAKEEPVAQEKPSKPQKKEVVSEKKEVKPTSLKETYKSQAESLISKIEGNAAVEEIDKLSQNLTKTGLAMIPALIKLHPECTEYLNAILKVGSTLHTLSLEEIESGYHADGKLPKMSSPTCYHGKDLVVHPATVTAMAKAGLSDRESAKHEIQEVIAHLGEVHLEKK
ncbi:MAG: hypothetical protein CL916_14880 [Deltaproteobacteria bacterium]|nr:hypothetical protein [Deltaproteobacteria bacterium]